MANFYADGVAEITRTAGTESYVLAGPLPGRTAFANAIDTTGVPIANGDTVYYRCADEVQQEIGLATYSAAGILTPSVIYSARGKVTWPAPGRRIITLEPASAAQIKAVYTRIDGDFATLTGGIGGVSTSLANYNTFPHTWTAKQTFSSADGSIGVLINGASKGIQFLPSSSGMTIAGVDNTGAGNQPLTVDGSTLTFSISGTAKLAIGPSSFGITAGSWPVTIDGASGTWSISGTTKLALSASSFDVTPTLNAVSNLIQLNGNNFASRIPTYHEIYDYSGNGAILLGGSGDPINYYRNTAHAFGDIGGGTNYFSLGTAGGVLGNPTGGFAGAGSLNAEALLIQGIGLQTVASHFQSTPTNPGAGVSSGSALMMGLGGSFTPSRSGVLHITICGTASNTSSGGTCNVQIRAGTGTAPGNLAALTGTAYGPKPSGNTAGAGQKLPFSVTGIGSGFSPGTTYWIDLAVDNGAGAGTANVANLGISVFEL